MRLKSVRSVSLTDLNDRARAFIGACGYEHRSSTISGLVSGPVRKIALCFSEWPYALARRENEELLVKAGFHLETVGANESARVQTIVSDVAKSLLSSGGGFAFDISSMTRAWHGAIVRELRALEIDKEIETFFAYVPAKFRRPSVRVVPNEFVEPVDGFAALRTPELPAVAVIGLGYEKERALGLQQFLDPERTVLMVPHEGSRDPYYAEVRKNNRGIFRTTPPERIFEYALTEPAEAFSTLASIVSGLRESYRVVLVSLGPKIFGIVCFLLASRYSDVSVWRISSGVHGKPRDAFADPKRLVVLSAVWAPEKY
jgi:hypothetical protein